MLIQLVTFETVSLLIQSALRSSASLKYVQRENIIISSPKERDTIPTYTDYLIRISAPDSGFQQKIPRIGMYYRNIYNVAIDLWIKSSSNLAGRLTSGNIVKQKGLYEFFQDIADTLEHNNFDGTLDSYPGSNIGIPNILTSLNNLEEGIGFIWSGNQDNLK